MEGLIIICLGIGLGIFFYLPSGMGAELLIRGVALLGILPVIWYAVMAVREREWASMDMLASIALIFSIVEEKWVSATFIALMLAAARLLERLTEQRTERSIRSLLNLRPATAKVDRNGTLVTVPIEALAVGDHVIVDVGERIAVDGRVLSGQAAVDESSLTGESSPVDKGEGDKVASGTLVASGSLRIRTTHVGKDTTLERIIALVESSRAEKPAIESLGERFGKAYLLIIFCGSIALFALTRDTALVLAVVLVVCADDVAIAIPLAYLRAIGSAAKRGIVIKGGRHLETFGQAVCFVFDKTGTLTQGRPTVQGLIPIAGVSEADLLATAALAAQRSTHPLSLAIMRSAKGKSIPFDEPLSAEVVGGKGVFAETPHGAVVIGRSIFMQEKQIAFPSALSPAVAAAEGQGQSILYVARAGKMLGCVALGDSVRPEAYSTIAALRELGVRRIIMLSGDNERAARFIATQVGIEECHANLLPEEKVSRLRMLRDEGVTVMVGDGVNDAAALAGAHVGVAMGALGADGAIESANIVLMHDDLLALPEVMRLARSVRKLSIQDFFIWGATNAIGLGLVFGGIIGPAGAAAYNFLSDFLPLANSVRARFPKKRG